MPIVGSDAAPARKQGRGLIWAGIAVAGVCLWLVARNTDLERVAQAMSRVSPGWLLAAAAVGVAANGVRAWRWRALLPLGSELRLAALFSATMLGYLANYILPARGGEVVRIWVAGRRGGERLSTLAGTVVVERLVDTVAMAAVLVIGLLPLEIPAEFRRVMLIPFGILAAAALVSAPAFVLAARGRGRSWIIDRCQHAWRLVPGHARLGGVVRSFLDGFQVLGHGRRLLTVAGITFCLWFAEAVLVALVLRALGLDLPWSSSLLVLGLLGLGLLLPSTPGAVGAYEFMVVTALTLQGVGSAEALAAALVLHALSFGITFVLGMLSLWWESLSLRQVSRMARSEMSLS